MRYTTLNTLNEHFDGIFGRRNALFLSGIADRLDGLEIAIDELQVAVRKERTDLYELRLSQVMAWFFACVNHYRRLPLAQSTCTKFPEGKCGHCGQSGVCGCDDTKRPPLQSNQFVSQKQMRWSLLGWQQQLKHTFGAKNEEKGVSFAFTRLTSEVSEVKRLTKPGGMIGRSPDVIETSISLEFADAFAWILGIASLLKVNMHDAVIRHYGKGCGVCHNAECSCPKHMDVSDRHPINADTVLATS